MTIRRPLALGAAATIGFGGLFIASPALAEDAASSVATIEANKYEVAAAELGIDDPAQVKQLEAADELVVSEGGFVAHKDPVHPSTGSLPEYVPGAIPGDPVTGSKPDAPVTVYLDFDGETLEGTNWNANPGTDDGSSIETLNFAPGSVTSQEQVWAAVAEDYAPFNVNVTTTRPSDDALYKTSEDDSTYGSHVIITDSYDETLPAATGTGGIAWLGGTGSEYLSGALVFTEGTEGNPKTIAEIASHESGHNFGLSHDGQSAQEDPEYYYPTAGLWGPIMGAGYGVPVTQWSNGSYAGSTTTEDDLSIITDRSAGGAALAYLTENGERYDGYFCTDGDPENPQPGDNFVAATETDCLPDRPLEPVWVYTDRADFAADDHGNDAAGATALDNATGSFESEGVVGNTGDVDAFNVSTAGGAFEAAVEVTDVSPNLNAELTLRDSAGTVVATDAGNPARDGDVATGLGASISESGLAEGTYTLEVTGVGTGDPTTATAENANGFTNYGSLGNYTLSGTAAPAEEPAIEAPAITSPADGSTVAGPASEITGTGVAGATLTLTGDVEGEVTVGEDGTWTIPANLGAGEYSVSATQSLGEDTSRATTSSFTVTEEPEAPEAVAITSITDGQEFPYGEGPSGVSGTGEPGASVTVTVGGETYTTTVGEDGTWAVDFGTRLVSDIYELTATQSIEGADDTSATVTFTVAAEGDAGGNAGGGDDANGDANGDDDLADTGGASVLPWALGAGALLIAGAATILVARRNQATEL